MRSIEAGISRFTGAQCAPAVWCYAPSRNDDKGHIMDFLAELWRFMRVRKKFWLLPIMIMMVVFGGLVVLTKGSAIAPFIYTLF